MELYYNDYSTFLKYYYNEPVYKIPINLADGNCPDSPRTHFHRRLHLL